MDHELNLSAGAKQSIPVASTNALHSAGFAYIIPPITPSSSPPTVPSSASTETP